MPEETAGREKQTRGAAARGIAKRGWARDVIRSITGRRRAEEALRESEGRYRELVETARDVIYTVSADGILLSLNPAFESLSGWSRAEWLGKPFAPMVHPDDLPTGAENFRRILRGEVPPVSEIRMLTKSGEYRIGEFAARPLIVDRQVVGSFGIVRDITERKRAEDALRESAERYRSTLDGMLEGCQIIGFDWRYVYLNDAVARHARRAKRELLGRTMMEMYPGIEDTEVFAYLRRCMEERIPHRMENEFTYPDGAKAWFELSIAPVPEGIFVLSLDVTERKRAEEALRESEERLRSTLDAMMEGCQIIGFDWRYVYLNDAVARHARRTKRELLGRTMMEMYPGIEDTEMFAYLRRCMEERIPHRMENEFTYPDGAKAWFELSIQPVPEGIFVLSLDITERKRAEEALQRAREELEAKAEHEILRRNPYGLTFRELTVLHLVAAGESDKQIALTLAISHLTAQKHISNILTKMGATSRTEASVRAVREGLLD